MSQKATAFAPATVANVAVGFDILGFALGMVGDRVTVSVDKGSTDVSVDSISGTTVEIPKDPAKNTAAVALRKMIAEHGIKHGFRVSIEKGIPLGSGMGGSAASAVAAVVAANALLKKRLSTDELLHCALAGEAVASGSIHADNVAPCLLGGLTIAVSTDPLQVVPVPVPKQIFCVLVHPRIVVETKAARALLKPTILLAEHVRQSAFLAGFIAGCYRKDPKLIRATMFDLLVEPQRSALIPGFGDAKAFAIAQGALGFSIAGSGPSVFAWVPNQAKAKKIQQGLVAIFARHGLECDAWVSPISPKGARVVGKK